MVAKYSNPFAGNDLTLDRNNAFVCADGGILELAGSVHLYGNLSMLLLRSVDCIIQSFNRKVCDIHPRLLAFSLIYSLGYEKSFTFIIHCLPLKRMILFERMFSLYNISLEKSIYIKQPFSAGLCDSYQLQCHFFLVETGT